MYVRRLEHSFNVCVTNKMIAMLNIGRGEFTSFKNSNCKKSSKYHTSFKRMYLLKALTFIKFLLYKQKCFFIKETDTFGRIVV